ncbi:MAG: hypothetical protein P8X47_12030 [Ignavibacteriaceae bacterium]
MKPLNEQIIMITGATDGIGKLTALELAKANALKPSQTIGEKCERKI